MEKTIVSNASRRPRTFVLLPNREIDEPYTFLEAFNDWVDLVAGGDGPCDVPESLEHRGLEGIKGR